jgi:hypothetical protein
VRYIRTAIEPTAQQLNEIEGTVIDATPLGLPGEILVAFDEKEYDRPEWLAGEDLNIPGEPHRCHHCGELI